jgi:hypothetical protein
MGLTGFNAADQSITLIDGGKTKFTTSNTTQIARGLVSIFTHADITKNQTIYIESFTTTQLEILELVETVSGKKWTVAHKTSEEQKNEGFKLFGEGNFQIGEVWLSVRMKSAHPHYLAPSPLPIEQMIR